MGKGEAGGAGMGHDFPKLCVGPGELWEMLKDWGEKVMCCICCCLCTGPILTIVGIILVVSAIKDKRGDNIKARWRWAVV